MRSKTIFKESGYPPSPCGLWESSCKQKLIAKSLRNKGLNTKILESKDLASAFLLRKVVKETIEADRG